MNTVSRHLLGYAAFTPPLSLANVSAEFPLLLLLPDRSLFSLLRYIAMCRAPQEPLAIATRLEVRRRAQYGIQTQRRKQGGSNS